MSDPRPFRLLIVDREPSICRLCARLGQSMGLLCFEAESAEEALQQLDSHAPDLMLADLMLGDRSGLELLAEVKKRLPLTEVAVTSANGTIASAVQAMRLGAYDFVVKPFRAGELQLLLERMVEKVRSARENASRCQPGTQTAPLSCTDLEELERLTMQRVFALVDGDKEQAQKLLGISRATLYRKLKRYGIQTRRSPRKVIAVSGEETRGTAKRMILLSQR
jgi:DNA-binding NtrC family response regulator